jgi:hypothetical protein
LPPEYTFVPWLRRGVAAEIGQDDTLGSDFDAGPLGRATLPVELTLKTVAVPGAAATAPAIRRDVSILGPADVAAIKAEATVRTRPPDGAPAATPGELAYVEFYEEDFPWRYTPAAPVQSRLRAWIALLVLTAEEFSVRERPGELAVLTPGPRAVLPPVTETWAWAHAQLSRVVAAAGDVHDEIERSPDSSLSRVLCPRRLLPETAYHAFLVPAFEAGRLVGLGRDPSQTPAQRPAWGTPVHDADRDLPVYLRFSFTTSAGGDFETLARRIRAEQAGERFGKRPLDVSDPGFGMTERPGATVDLEGALAPPDFEQTRATPDPTLGSEVQALVDATENRRLATGVGDDPLVVPPIHGRWHRGVPRVADVPAGDWLAELNLDLRQRAAAGLGADIVRARQEEFVQRAWEQVGAVEAANQRLREAELARGAADTLMRKHIAQSGAPDRLLVLTSATHAGLPIGAGATVSIRGAIDASAVPAAAESAAFRRITRPQRPMMRRLTGGWDAVTFQDELLTQMNAEPDAALSAAPPAGDPAAGIDLQTVRSAVATADTEFAAKQDRPDRLFLAMTLEALRTLLAASPPLDLDGPGAVGALQGAITVDPASPLAPRLTTLVNSIVGVESDPPDRAVVTLTQSVFDAEFGAGVGAKMLRGLTVRGEDVVPAEVVPVAGSGDVQAFASALGTLQALDLAREDPPAPPPLSGLAALPGHVLGALDPAATIADRVISGLPGVDRPATDPRRLAPVLAHPTFADPLFEPLRALSQDHVIPNVSDLPRDTMTVLEPNRRFIEAVLAGANHAFMAELLWREYPTDQRGTSFKVFWDTRDALAAPGREDVTSMDGWSGALGAHLPAGLPSQVLVLVIRGELLERYPRTHIFAQQAKWPGSDHAAPRVLDPAGEVRQPILHARLEPDITLAGFDLGETEARGRRPGDPGTGPDDPGWFFVLMERPGEPRFGADDDPPPGGLQTWNDLHWGALTFPGGTPNIELAANAAVAPAAAQPATWGRTAADMAAILFQQPVLLARHASEMLP